MIDNDTAAALASILERELDAGERVLWRAQPAPLCMVKKAAPSFLLGIFFFAFAVFWTWGASGGMSRNRGPEAEPFHWFGIVWGTPFILIGAASLLSPFWSWWTARRTLYVITNRRAILLEAPFRRRIQSFRGECLINVTRDEDRLGRGHVIFEREAKQGNKGRTIYRDVGFFGLADAKGVEDLLREVHSSTTADTRK